ncbi:MAG TPA: cytochrome c3 family protein [Oligoflexus sp.]|uniref:cytochrome c3 family protein n=1 Tax=Oligoflexus sp. TaxID=1971216 RepID=UPI002D7E6FCC|nr:cytochrome c3 family protein [Oligoflexus sp.]HET9241289.1 cytochrome c3 family protein [Oligoflexus sp.]
MAQLFSKKADHILRMVLIGIVLLGGLSIALGYGWSYSSFNTNEHMVVQQTVPFSHEHHVGGLGIDCRYCHTSVEVSAHAGLPASSICMNCHSQIWSESAMLEPVRDSFAGKNPLVWAKVNDLPDFVYFNHSIHITKGIGCESCHGRVDRMPLMEKVHSFHMEWCLECHRDPAPHVRPREALTVMGWEPKSAEQAPDVLARQYKVQSKTDCYACHR